MTIELEVQNVSDQENVPDRSAFSKWLASVLGSQAGAGLTIRIVNEAEMQSLNKTYRGQDKPTNVLAFPAELPESVIVELDIPLLGDLVICASVVEREAKEQGKAVENHWAHLTVHGALHLLGYDHQDDQQATEMEMLEVQYLSELGIPDPYADE